MQKLFKGCSRHRLIASAIAFLVSEVLTVALVQTHPWTAQACAGAINAAQGDYRIHSLAPGESIERTLSAGETHSYLVMLVAGQYLRAVIDQPGVDIVASLFSPDDKRLIQIKTH